ncbi:MAG: hypothetical protein UMU04_04115, partial [Halanaerobiales bacterium]|nr:hypothetical protein [Halanaerobiales bacterium]
ILKKIIVIGLLIIFSFSISVFAVDDSTLYDVYNLRVDADYKVDMGARFKHMQWMPAVSLGKPDTNKVEIYDLKNDFKLARKEINNVYEALMFIHLFFEAESGNLKSRYQSVEWEFQEPAELVFQSRDGNCAGMSGLVHYLLEGDYEEEGLMWRHLNKDAERYGGHIINYVKHRGNYYFFDVLSVTPSNDSYPVENGSMSRQGRVDWADPIIQAEPEEYMEFIHGAADFSLFALFKNSDYIIGSKGDQFYLPAILSRNSARIYVTENNKLSIEKYRQNPEVPAEYRSYAPYSQYKDQLNNEKLEIVKLGF